MTCSIIDGIVTNLKHMQAVLLLLPSFLSCSSVLLRSCLLCLCLVRTSALSTPLASSIVSSVPVLRLLRLRLLCLYCRALLFASLHSHFLCLCLVCAFTLNQSLNTCSDAPIFPSAPFSILMVWWFASDHMFSYP